MARNEIVIDAPPETVYEVLLDADAYPQWVVGARGLRGVDRDWPRKGSRFHHRIGPPIVNIDDSSTIVDKKRNRRVVLQARFRPLGEARVVLDLKPRARGRQTRVAMVERPTAGLARWLWGPVLSFAVSARNAVALRRLRRLVASRTGGAE